MAKSGKSPPKENLESITAGERILNSHPLFSRLAWNLATTNLNEDFAGDAIARLHTTKSSRNYWSSSGWYADGMHCTIELNAWKRLSPPEWAHVLAQGMIHHYFCHADPSHRDHLYGIACSIIAYDFLTAISIGTRPETLMPQEEPHLGHDLESVVRNLREAGAGTAMRFSALGLNGSSQSPFTFSGDVIPFTALQRRSREDALASAIRSSVVKAIDQAGEMARGPTTAKRSPNSMAERARSWFVASYPLLASLAAGFEIVEDEVVCQTLDIAVAAIDGELGRVYINPKFPWTYEGMKFVIAHELLHVGLRHEPRRQGRDPYLWNVACDFVINGWLVQMGVGEMPTDDLLLDPELAFEKDSAEAIYDRIAQDLRLMRRLSKGKTLRGRAKPDMISSRPYAWWNGPGTDLDGFYRRALNEGLDLHVNRGVRGLLPGGLVEEIRALQQKPIPWDVRLGQWLDAFFPPMEARRTFARASRRQASTPDIARPVWVRPEELMSSRTFGVVLDTSGSMSQRLLAKALGAIASYGLSREVARIRVLQCDAGVHDMGYVDPESLLNSVEIRGRGGTVLQPAISKLQADESFPKDAPILIITDGWCDTLTLGRDHAYLMPEGRRLPFSTHAPRFAFESD